MTLTATTVGDRSELQQILDLQRENLASALSPEEARTQGFVTVQHTLERLEQMHALAPSIIVKSGRELAGRFELLVTEIATRNPRSLRAHERVGFEPIHRYRENESADEWVIVAWDWSKQAAPT